MAEYEGHVIRNTQDYVLPEGSTQADHVEVLKAIQKHNKDIAGYVKHVLLPAHDVEVHIAEVGGHAHDHADPEVHGRCDICRQISGLSVLPTF